MSSSQPRLQVNQNINSREFLESRGGRGLKSSTNMQSSGNREMNEASKTTH